MAIVYPPRMSRSQTATPASRKTLPKVSAEGTRSAILSAAQQILEDEGYAKLSLRNVAEAAGIAVGNLTYHFPNKQELIRAVIAALVVEFGAGMAGRFDDISKSAAEKFELVIDWLNTESAARKTSRIFRELWVMALHDAFVAGALDDFYDELMGHAVAMLCLAQPGLTQASASEIVHLATMITEGSSVLYGTRPDRAADLRAVTRLAADLLGGAVRMKANGD